MRREIPYLQEAMHYSAYCTMYNILMIHFFEWGDDFLKISEHFLKISEDSPKVVQRPDNCFRKFFKDCRRFPKITKDIRITHRNTSKNFLRDYATIARCSLQQYCSFPTALPPASQDFLTMLICFLEFFSGMQVNLAYCLCS